MSKNNIKFVNNINQTADSTMIMSFLNNSLLGSILKTDKGEYFIIIEDREQISQYEYTSIFVGYTLVKNILGKYEYIPIARASTDEVTLNGEPDIYYLATLLVEEKYRDRGIGSSILKFLQSIAADRGYKKFELNSTTRFKPNKFDPTHEADANEYFYLKNGYTPIALRSETRSMTRFSRNVKESDLNKNKNKENEDELANSIQ